MNLCNWFPSLCSFVRSLDGCTAGSLQSLGLAFLPEQNSSYIYIHIHEKINQSVVGLEYPVLALAVQMRKP